MASKQEYLQEPLLWNTALHAVIILLRLLTAFLSIHSEGQTFLQKH